MFSGLFKLQFDIDTIGEMLEVDRRAVMLIALATLWLGYKFAFRD